MTATTAGASPSTETINPDGGARDLERLYAIVRALSFGRKAVTLASGKPSTFYFDMKPSMLDPEGASLIARLIFEHCRAVEAAFVGGLEMGAVPITGAVCLHSHNAGMPMAGYFVRKKAKDYGAKKLVEGLAPGVSLAGRRVVILEDVTTTGQSALQVVAALREAGAEIVLAISIVDREEGARDNFAAEGIRLISLLSASRFLDDDKA